MSRNLKPVFIRGLFGAVLSIVAVSAAATQALGFDGDIRFEQGRLVLVEVPRPTATCDRAAHPAPLSAAVTAR